jgi:predicted anti-sigma-YlaC factor YlaD
MNCRDIESLLLAERDGVLTSEQHAALAKHVAACPACRQMRSSLAEALTAFQADAASVEVPDADEEWRVLRAELRGQPARPAKKRPLAPIIWFSAPLAAAAAIALVYIGFQSKPVESPAPTAQVAQADFVEAGNANASTMVYVDKESGWLVVWAAEGDAATSG